MSKSPTLPDEQPQSSDDMASRSTAGYEALRNLWTQPPQPLPGPDDHPFFKMFAPNAYGPSSQPDSNHTTPNADATSDTETASKKLVFEMPLVYPFVPAPSISMEPMTPEIDSATTPSEHHAASFSQHSTPSLSFSNLDHDSSPESRPSTAEGPWSLETQKNLEDIKANPTAWKEQDITPPGIITNQELAEDDANNMEVDAICILTYMRAIPNSETSEPAVIANGQIWRSPDKKKGWRRNQWVVDVR